jgi:hypothetical protein
MTIKKYMKYANYYKLIILLIIGLMLYFNINYTTWTDGDEPHYIVTTQSIVKDKDLDLSNQQSAKSYTEFRSNDNLNIHSTKSLNGQSISTHGIASSVFYSPAYYTGINIFNNPSLMIRGARLTQFLIFLIGLLFSLILIITITKEIDWSFLIPWIISPTVFLYATVLFPDMIQGVGFVITALGLYALHNNIVFKTKLNYLLIIFSGIIAGINIFVHFKTLLTTGLFIIMYTIYALIINRKLIFNTKIFLFLIPFLSFVGIHMTMTYQWFNTVSFSSIQGFTAIQGYNKSLTDLLPNNPLIGFTGQIWDIDKGVFWMGMTVLLYLFGFKDWFIKSRFTFFVFGIPSIISILIYSCYIEWAAGFCPAGRYLVPFMFVLLPSYYFSFINIKNYIWGKFYIFTSIIFSILVLISFQKGFHRNGFPSLQALNLHYTTISRLLKIPDMNNFLRFLDFETKPVFGLYGLIGLLFFGIISIQFVSIYKLLIVDIKTYSSID